MIANRYTQPNQGAQYNPMSLQEIMMVPTLKRQQHDQLLNNLATTQTGIAQVDPLSLHSDAARAEQERIEKSLQSQIDEVSKTGITGKLKGDFMSLNADYQKSMSATGTLGSIQNAKAKLTEYRDTYIANATNMGYSPDQAKANWADNEAKYASEFATTGKVKEIDQLYAPNYHNISDEVLELAKLAGVNATDIGNMSSSIKYDENGGYVLNTGSETVTQNNIKQLEALVDHMNNQINNPNSAIRKSMDHQGLRPEDALEMVAGLAPIVSSSKYGHKTTSTISGWKSPSELGIAGHAGGELNYEAEAAENIQLEDKSTINKLDKIISGAQAKDGYATDGGMLLDLFGLGSKGEKSSVQNQLNEAEVKQLSSEYERLRSGNPKLAKFDFGTKESLVALSEFKKNNLNIQRQNVIITDDYMTTYGDNSIGTSKSDKESIKKAVLGSAQFRKYEIDGKVYTYDELPSDIKENFTKGLDYAGYYSSQNFLSYKYGQDENKNMFASPLAMSVTDANGKRINMRVSRSAGEMNKASYKADLAFNDVFINANIMPNVPYKVPGSNGSVEVEYNSTSQAYTVSRKGADGRKQKSQPMSSSDLQAAFYGMFKVTPDATKKQKK